MPFKMLCTQKRVQILQGSFRTPSTFPGRSLIFSLPPNCTDRSEEHGRGTGNPKEIREEPPWQGERRSVGQGGLGRVGPPKRDEWEGGSPRAVMDPKADAIAAQTER